MPDFPIIDTHLHIWQPEGLIRYPWLATVPALNRSFLLDDYDGAIDGVQVEKMVFLQCECHPAQYELEAAWVTECAQRDLRIAAIVPWAPVEKGLAAREGIQRVVAANPLVRGIRRILQFEGDPNFGLHPDFIAGVQMLGPMNLHFEICIKGDDQMRAAITLARLCPDTRFVLDHIGKPFIKERTIEPWATLMKELAVLPNVWCKISGVVTEADWPTWTVADITPYILTSIREFGLDRVMFGGDWPVLLQAGSFVRWVAALDDILRQAECSDDQATALYRTNAMAFYRI